MSDPPTTELACAEMVMRGELHNPTRYANADLLRGS